MCTVLGNARKRPETPGNVPGNLAKTESYRNPVPDVFMR
jgi:hypothetical protein